MSFLQDRKEKYRTWVLQAMKGLLQPDEQVAVISETDVGSASPLLMLLGNVFFRARYVVVTNRRVLLFRQSVRARAIGPKILCNLEEVDLLGTDRSLGWFSVKM